MGLCINIEKSKFMVTSRRDEDRSNLHIDNFTFEKVVNFKYLGLNINCKSGISYRIANKNKRYYSINRLIKSVSLPPESQKFYLIQVIQDQ